MLKTKNTLKLKTAKRITRPFHVEALNLTLKIHITL